MCATALKTVRLIEISRRKYANVADVLGARKRAAGAKPFQAAVTNFAGADAPLAHDGVHVATVHMYTVEALRAGPAYGAETDSALVTLPESHTVTPDTLETTTWYACTQYGGYIKRASGDGCNLFL